MQKYIERMKTELSDLSGKISRTEKAVENPPFGSEYITLYLNYSLKKFQWSIIFSKLNELDSENFLSQ